MFNLETCQRAHQLSKDCLLIRNVSIFSFSSKLFTEQLVANFSYF